MSEVILLTVSPSLDSDGRLACSGRGQLFDGVVGGQLIVTRSSQSLLDGARALLAEGIDPRTRIVVRHAGHDTDALRSTVGAAASLSIAEGERVPRFIPWKVSPHATERPPIALADPAATSPCPN